MTGAAGGIVVFIIFFMGAAVGSWLNVVILRGIKKQSMILDRSNCMSCEKDLRWWELVPMVSFTFLKARCSRCRAPISSQYPIVEFFMGLFTLMLFFPLPVSSIEWLSHGLLLAILAVLVILFFIDFYTFLLPDFYVVLLTVLSIIYIHVNGTLVDSHILWSILIGSGFLFMLWALTKGQGIGFGDVKLMIPLSMLVGVQGTVALLWLAFLSGALIGIYLLTTSKASLKTAVPFGPYLIGAAIIILLAPELPNYLFSFLLG